MASEDSWLQTGEPVGASLGLLQGLAQGGLGRPCSTCLGAGKIQTPTPVQTPVPRGGKGPGTVLSVVGSAGQSQSRAALGRGPCSLRPHFGLSSLPFAPHPPSFSQFPPPGNTCFDEFNLLNLVLPIHFQHMIHFLMYLTRWKRYRAILCGL